MGYYVEFRDADHEELMEKVRKAKKAICEACDAFEKMGQYSERGNGSHYRGNGSNMGRGGNMDYRGMYRQEYDYDR